MMENLTKIISKTSVGVGLYIYIYIYIESNSFANSSYLGGELA